LYNCSCDDCKAQKTTFTLAFSDKFKQLLNVGSKAFKHLHKNGKYSPEDLKTEKPYQNLIQSTFDIFNFAITDNDMPETMQKALQSDAFLFGSLKANAQLFEASKLLLNDDGRLKPFSEVSKQFDKLNVNYNQNYLEAEYEFAVASSQMASKWTELGSSDRYNLQYRTAKDERVRESHQALADITLPKEDPFWSSFYPPNGWRCRCTAVEVLKDKYEVSSSEVAIKAGEKATTEIGKDGKNRLEIFRFNPGQKQVVFPPTHPYGKVKGAKQVKESNIEVVPVAKSKKKVPFEMNDATIAKLKKLGFDIEDTPEGRNYFNKNYKGFDFESLDNVMEGIAKNREFQYQSKKINLYANSTNFSYSAYRGDFYLSRNLIVKDNVRTVYHNYFQLPNNFQDGGTSRNVFKELYSQYKASKIKQIDVTAGLDVGGYAWARYGFLATDINDVMRIRYKAERFLNDGKINEAQFKDLNKIISSNKRKKAFPMYLIAETNYGKDLLLETNWKGKIDLSNKIQRIRFENYLYSK
jgi:Phage Mu protein F like protein